VTGVACGPLRCPHWHRWRAAPPTTWRGVNQSAVGSGTSSAELARLASRPCRSLCMWPGRLLGQVYAPATAGERPAATRRHRDRPRHGHRAAAAAVTPPTARTPAKTASRYGPENMAALRNLVIATGRRRPLQHRRRTPPRVLPQPFTRPWTPCRSPDKQRSAIIRSPVQSPPGVYLRGSGAGAISAASIQRSPHAAGSRGDLSSARQAGSASAESRLP
jgi:hypothetical protein